MPSVKNAVFTAAAAIAYTVQPPQVEAVPANVLAFQKPNLRDIVPAGQPPLALSHGRQLKDSDRITTYTVERLDREPVMFWEGDSRCQSAGDRIDAYFSHAPERPDYGQSSWFEANCSGSSHDMIRHTFIQFSNRARSGYFQERWVDFFQPVLRPEDAGKRLACRDLTFRGEPCETPEARPFVHDVTVATAPCTRVYSAATPSIEGNAVITASLIAFAAIARTLG